MGNRLKVILSPLTGELKLVSVSATGTLLLHETDENGDSMPVNILVSLTPPFTYTPVPTLPAPSNIDSNGDLEPAATITYPQIIDPYYELDVNGDIQQKAGV
jgi:hypothetical protein